MNLCAYKRVEIKKCKMKNGKLNRLEANQLVKPKISLEEFKKMLNKGDDCFSDDDIKDIRDFLYVIAEIDFIMFNEYMKNKEEQLLETIDEVKILPINDPPEENKEYLKSA